MDALDELKRLYYQATKATIQKDLDRAIDLLKTLASEDERERVAVYMDGLSQMRSEWSAGARPKAASTGATSRAYLSRTSSAPRPGSPRGRSGRS